MNIKVKAGLEVAGFVVLATIVGGLIQIGLEYINTAYTKEQILNGVAFAFTATAAYVAVSLLYDIRVARLQYRAKLEEMTKK